MGNGKNNVWGDSMLKRPEVSIICYTYNHERSVKDALNSFIAQKTNFPIEILIYDNASTDNTVAIINEYEKLYPEMIKPIIQKEHLHHNEVDGQQINFERARGKYIAICNGDSFWLDEYKLQRQVDYLEKTKNCVLSVHAVKVIDVDGRDLDHISSPSKMSRFYNTTDLINGDSQLFSTSSMLFRTYIIKNRPSLFMNLPVKMRDYVLTLYLSLFGQVHFMRDVMSCYQANKLNFLTTLDGAIGELNQHYPQEMGEWLLQFDEWTNYSFHNAIEAKLLANQFKMEGKGNNKMDAMALQSDSESMPLKQKVAVYFEHYLPQFAERLKRKRWRMYQQLYRRHY